MNKVSSLEDAVKLDPSSADASVRLATLEAAEGRYSEAEAGFKQAVSVNPKLVSAAGEDGRHAIGRPDRGADTIVTS